MADSNKDVEKGVASPTLPEVPDSDPQPSEIPFATKESVEEVKKELRHEIQVLATDTHNEMRKMEQRLHGGMSELYAAIADIRRALGVKSEPRVITSVAREDNVLDAPLAEDNEPELLEEKEPESVEEESEGEEPRAIALAEPKGKEAGFMRKLPEYSGDVPWEDYFAQFKIIQEARGWDNGEAALQLAASLRGPAVSVLGSLHENNQADYRSLIEALDRRFGKSFGPEVYRARLKARFRRKGEPLAHLAQDIENLAQKAFPQLARVPMGIEDIAITYFIDAIKDRQLQLYVMQSRPRNISQALTTAIQMESFMQTAVKEEDSSPYKVTQENKYVPWKHHSNGGNGKQMSPVTPVVRARPAKVPMGSPRLLPTAGGFEGTCWQCGRKGHLKNNCPERHQPQQTAAASGQGHSPWGEGSAARRVDSPAPPRNFRRAGNGDSLAVDTSAWPVRR